MNCRQRAINLWDAPLDYPPRAGICYSGSRYVAVGGNGAIATSTHGAGEKFGSLSSMVTAMRLVNAGGEVIECSADINADLFNAARTNMGALGAVSQIRLQLADAFKLKRRQWIMPFDEALERVDELRASNRNFEFFALPHTDYVFAIVHNETDEDPNIESRYAEEDSYETFRMMSEVYDWVPGFMRHRLGNMAARTVEPEIEIGRAFEIFSNSRDIRNNEMEYSLPAELAPRALRALRAHPLGKDAQVIGRVEEGPEGVFLQTRIGGTRPLLMLEGEQLPRIC